VVFKGGEGSVMITGQWNTMAELLSEIFVDAPASEQNVKGALF
jgi:hypothetical protein